MEIERTYRRLHTGEGLAFFSVRLAESDLSIGAAKSLKPQALAALEKMRRQVEGQIRRQPAFLTSFSPVPETGGEEPVPLAMCRAGASCGVGPMAAVAGAVAQAVGEALLAYSDEVVVENGGDLYLHLTKSRVAAIYAGDSPLSERVGIRLAQGVWGLCTSSGRTGPSVSLGKAHAAVALAHDAALADAAATALGNRILTEDDLSPAVEEILRIPGVLGALAIVNDKLAAAGQMELVPLRLRGK